MGARGYRGCPRNRRGCLLPGACRRSGRGPPTPTPSVTSSAAIPLPSAGGDDPAGDGSVYPGTYVPVFDPGLTFTIDREVQHNCGPGFKCRGTVDANLPGWVNIEFGLPRIELHVVRVDKVNDPANPGALIDPPADLATWIASRPGVTVNARKAVQVGGLPATQLDIRTGDEELSFGPIPGVADPGLGLGANWTVRLFVVPVDGRQVLIMLHAEDGSVTELQPFVDSIVWH
jgi:hypothetical protein